MRDPMEIAVDLLREELESLEGSDPVGESLPDLLDRAREAIRRMAPTEAEWE